jgi:thioredoxin reductase (NADPH)
MITPECRFTRRRAAAGPRLDFHRQRFAVRRLTLAAATDRISVMERVVVIGSGPAAWTAALYAARAGLGPLVFEGAVTAENQQRATLPLGQLNLADPVENYPGFPQADAHVLARLAESALPEERYASLRPVSEGSAKYHPRRAIYGAELVEFMRQQAHHFGARVLTQDVSEVELRRHPFLLLASEGLRMEALAVILATGRVWADAFTLPAAERFRNNGISGCAVSDGSLPRFRGRPVVVVGAGDSSLEDARYLARFAARVHVVPHGQVFRPRWMGRSRFESLLSDPKLEMWRGWMVEDVLGSEDAGITGVLLRDPSAGTRRELACSGIFPSQDFTRPNTDLVRGQVELTEYGHVRWVQPPRTFTSVEGVFAAGDVADDHYRQEITAAASGCRAALDAERWLADRGLAS